MSGEGPLSNRSLTSVKGRNDVGAGSFAAAAAREIAERRNACLLRRWTLETLNPELICEQQRSTLRACVESIVRTVWERLLEK